VPAISLNKGKEIIWESKDILLALEEKFPGTPALLPAEGEARTKVRQRHVAVP
jgi:glutathione S-transferase